MNNHSNLPVFQFSVRLWFEFLMLIILPHPIQCLCAIPLFMPQGHELSLVINPARKHGDISGECSIHSLDSFIANRPQTLNTNRTNIVYNHLFPLMILFIIESFLHSGVVSDMAIISGCIAGRLAMYCQLFSNIFAQSTARCEPLFSLSLLAIAIACFFVLMFP